MIDPMIVTQNSPIGREINQQQILDKLNGLGQWVQNDFNKDHENGREAEKLNPTLRFIVGLFKLTNMRPWQYVSYLTSLAYDLPFTLTGYGFEDEDV